MKLFDLVTVVFWAWALFFAANTYNLESLQTCSAEQVKAGQTQSCAIRS